MYIPSAEPVLRQASEQGITVSELIAMQRMLARSEKPFERLVGVLWAAGALQQRLCRLTDRQIGQLMYDHFGHDIGMLLPESVICQHAIRRLFRSAGGALTAKDIDEQAQHAICPKCGNDMLFRYGISSPNCLECMLLNCGHKQLLKARGEVPCR